MAVKEPMTDEEYVMRVLDLIANNEWPSEKAAMLIKEYIGTGDKDLARFERACNLGNYIVADCMGLIGDDKPVLH